MKRLLGLGLLLAVLIGAFASHGKSSNSTSTGSAPPAASTLATTTPARAKPAAPRLHYTSCDQHISVGPATTCGFAANVFRAYVAQVSREGNDSGDITVSATSPATGKTYAMRCSPSAGSTLCTGGKSARVRFPLHAAQIYTPHATPTPEAPSTSTERAPESGTPEPESPTSGTSESSEPQSSSPGSSECTAGAYENSSGNIVCKPEESPSGPPAAATAECVDGTYSFSEHRSGTCSYHGGVARWLN